MLRRSHVEPFLRERQGKLEVDYLDDPDGRVERFLDRLCRLVSRLKGRSRRTVIEAIRRQERRVRDGRRLAGIGKTLTDACRFRPVAGAERSAEIRRALFAARGRRWPPMPGDDHEPYGEAASSLGMDVPDVHRLLYADDPACHVLTRAPRLTGRRLLARYNLDLARGVLLDAERIVVSARGGWRDVFRAVKLARLMYRLERRGSRRFRLEITGPASPWVARPQRYGTRFVRVVPAVARAPGWRIDADVARGDRRATYTLAPDRRLRGWKPPGRPRRYDSSWEQDLAEAFAGKLGDERDGWTLTREDTPVTLGAEVFLPDFTFRHADGRQALVEIVGFWTPEYLSEKLRKVRAAGLENLVLVVYEALAAGSDAATGSRGATSAAGERPVAEDDAVFAGAAAVVRFAKKPRIGPVMEAVERVARRTEAGS